MRTSNKIIRLVLYCLTLTVFLAASAKADSVDIENLVFTGTATCTAASCASFGSGPLTGTYSLDVDTQTIVGPWSFSTPFGVISSTDAGALGTVVGSAGIGVPGLIGVLFDENVPPFFEFVSFLFPSTNSQQLGALDNSTITFSDACYSIPGSTGCFPGYVVTGSTALATPEPSTLILLGSGIIGLLSMSLKKSFLARNRPLYKESHLASTGL